MTEITLLQSQWLWYSGGKSGASAVAGNDWDTNTDKPLHRVGRYKITSPSNGASHIKLLFHSVHGGGDVIPLRYYFGTDPESHVNAGPDAAYHGTLTWNSGEYSHTADAAVTLVPNQTYYLWIFPGSDDFGWFYGYRTTYDSELTLSGSAMTDITAGDGTLGIMHTVKLTMYGSSMTHTLTAKCGTKSLTIATGVNTDTVEWTPPLEWSAQNTTGISVPVTITCVTYNGGTKIGSRSITLTFAIPASVKPAASIATSDIKGYLDAYGSYIQGKSQVKVQVSAEGIYGSTVKSCVISCGSQTATGTGGTFSLPTSGKVTVKAVVTDSRGRSTNETATIDVSAYAVPTVQITSAYRCDVEGNEDNDGGAYGTAVFNAAVTSLDGKNEARYTLKYRVRGTPTWTSIAISDLSGNYAPAGAFQVFPADAGNAYEVCIAVKDDFTESESTYRVVGASFALAQVKKSISSVSLGMPATVEKAFQLGLKLMLYKGVKLTAVQVASWDVIDAALDAAVINLENQSMDFLLFEVGSTSWHCILFKEDSRNAAAEFFSHSSILKKTMTDGIWGQLYTNVDKGKISREYENNDYMLALTYHTTGSDVQSGKSRILMYISKNGVDFAKVGVLPVEVNANLYDLSVTYHKGQWVIVYDCIDRTHNDWTDENNSYNRGGNRVGVLTTPDFVNFTNRFIDLPAEWKSTWAPEIFVNSGRLYIALTISTCTKTFTTITGSTRYVKDGIYICKLNDDFSLAEYTEITLPDDGITPENYIDASVYRANGKYYLAIKEENFITQRLYKSSSLLGGYELVHEFEEMGEGMAIVEFNGRYYAYSDKFVDAGRTDKRGTYLCVSEDMETWSSMVLVNTQGDAWNRHHTPFVVTEAEQKASISNFLQSYGSVDTAVESSRNKSYLLAKETEHNVIERLLLQPNAVYYVINAGQVTINSVDTSLMDHGDTCKFFVTGRNSRAAITFKYSEENLLYWGNTKDLEFKCPDGTITVCCTHGGSNKYCFADVGAIHRDETVSFTDGVALRLLRNGKVVTAMLSGTVDSLTKYTERTQTGVLPSWAVPPRSLTFCGTVVRGYSHLGCVLGLNVNGDVTYSADQDVTSTWISVNATYQVD